MVIIDQCLGTSLHKKMNLCAYFLGAKTEPYFVTNRAHQEFEGLYYDVPVIDPCYASVYELFT